MKKLLKKYGIDVSKNYYFFDSIFSGKCFDAENKEVSSDVIEKLLTISELKNNITHKGLEIENAIINNKLDLGYIKINFPIFFKNTTFNEGIDLRLSNIESLKINCKCIVKEGIQLNGAIINGQLNFKGSTFKNFNGKAINAQNAIVKGHVFLSSHNKNDFISKGIVDLDQISIRGNFICSGAFFKNLKEYKKNEPVALNFNRAKITGSVNMDNGFKAKGEVRFIGAQISGSLYCEGGNFCNHRGRAINAKMIKVGGDVFFDDFKNKNRSFNAKGEVKLSGAQIAGQLRCCDARFKEPKEIIEVEYGTPVDALLAKGIKINGPLFMNNIMVKGKIDLTDAKINGRFELTNIKNIGLFSLILKSVYANEFKDDEFNWRKEGKLDIQDFTYDIISETELKEKSKIKVIIDNRIDRGFFPEESEFSHQPYLQMANVLEKSGYDNGAKHLRIRMNDKKRESNITFLQKVWLFFLKYLIGYGYKPFIILRWAFVIWFIGALLFSLGSKENNELIMPPSKFAWEETNPSYQKLYKHYTNFNPWIYSLDVFLPIVNLGQQEHWKPDTDIVYYISTKLGEIKLSGCFLLMYVYFEILLGWFLTSMLAIGISGLVKQK